MQQRSPYIDLEARPVIASERAAPRTRDITEALPYSPRQRPAGDLLPAPNSPVARPYKAQRVSSDGAEPVHLTDYATTKPLAVDSQRTLDRDRRRQRRLRDGA